MLDFRMQTFLTVCQTMNYTKAAAQLNITQPAVTQHIQYLEKEYHCLLFSYQGKTLTQTQKGKQLEAYTRAMMHNDQCVTEQMKLPLDENRCLKIGATKTIGDFVIGSHFVRYFKKYPQANVNLTVDNTHNLLRQLEEGIIDVAMIEGYFEKSHYQFRLIRQEPFVGVCGADHVWANQTISFSDLFTMPLFVRESGSGTRAILEEFLKDHNYTLKDFKKQTVISNFSVIKQLIRANLGISFMYQSAAQKELHQKTMAVFQVENCSIFHEFNYVYLPNNLWEGSLQEFFEA